MRELLDAFVKYEEGEGYIPQGQLIINLLRGKWTSIYYYNDPMMAIPVYEDHKFFVPDEFPYYLIKRKSRLFPSIDHPVVEKYRHAKEKALFYGGTYKEIKEAILGKI